ncbi:MAG: peptidoglycan-binding protein [Cyanobacteria bacterium P01_D01_bin.128]
MVSIRPRTSPSATPSATVRKQTLAAVAIAVAATELANDDRSYALYPNGIDLNADIPCRSCTRQPEAISTSLIEQSTVAVDSHSAIRWSALSHFSPKQANAESDLALSSPNQVRYLQKRLNQHGFDTPIDGVFSDQTKQALAQFQAIHGLKAGGSTLDAETLALLQGDNQPPPTPQAEPASSRALLRQGSQGAVVRQLQQLLIYQGYILQIDGYYGPETQRAVTEFQILHNLSADGVAGPETIRSLLAASHIQT